MNSVSIVSSSWSGGVWTVECSISIGRNTYRGMHCVELPESASQKEISDALIALYVSA